MRDVCLRGEPVRITRREVATCPVFRTSLGGVYAVMHTTTSAKPAAQAGSIISVRLILGMLVSLAGSGLFALLWDSVEDKKRHVTHFDQATLHWLHVHQEPWLLPIARGLAFLGSPPTIVGIAVLGVILGLIWRKVRGAAWTLPIAVVGAGIIIQGMKLEFHRPRPTLYHQLIPEKSYSFPSGHSLIAVVVYGLLGYFAMHVVKGHGKRTVVAAVTIVLILAIGISRPYVQVHYPSDVLAGWAGGIPWLMTCIGLHEVLARRFAGAGEPVLAAPGAGNASKPLGVGK